MCCKPFVSEQMSHASLLVGQLFQGLVNAGLAEGVDLWPMKRRRGVALRSPTAVLSAIPLQAALHKVHSDVANPKRFWAFGSNPACCRYQRLQLPAGMLGKP